MRGNISVYKGIRSYQYIISYGNVADNCGIDSNPHRVPDHRHSLARAAVLLPYSHPLVNIAVTAYLCF